MQAKHIAWQPIETAPKGYDVRVLIPDVEFTKKGNTFGRLWSDGVWREQGTNKVIKPTMWAKVHQSGG